MSLANVAECCSARAERPQLPGDRSDHIGIIAEIDREHDGILEAARLIDRQSAALSRSDHPINRGR